MIKEAIILAAGKARRLSAITKGRPKFLLEIEGKPLIYYTLAMLKLYNVERVNIVVSSDWYNEAMFVLSDLNFPFEIELIENDAVDRENGYSFLLTKTHVRNQSFLLLMSDHLFSRDLLDAFINEVAKTQNSILLVGGDGDPKFVDIEEATKILTDEKNRILDIGKQLKSFNYIDIGLFYAQKSIFERVNHLLDEKYIIKFSDIVKVISSTHDASVIDLSNMLWTELDTPSDYFDLLNGERRIILENILKFLGGAPHER
ncbi:MAG: NTP transferase domain-containing protein [Candidatus Asgardarchaeia archaeon]